LEHRAGGHDVALIDAGLSSIRRSEQIGPIEAKGFQDSVGLATDPAVDKDAAILAQGYAQAGVLVAIVVVVGAGAKGVPPITSGTHALQRIEYPPGVGGYRLV
jgi:hypothetical protein